MSIRLVCGIVLLVVGLLVALSVLPASGVVLGLSLITAGVGLAA